MRGTMSASTKNMSSLLPMGMPCPGTTPPRSFVQTSKGESAACVSLLLDTWAEPKNCTWLTTCRMSWPQASTTASICEASTLRPSLSSMALTRRATARFSGRLNLMSKQCAERFLTCWSPRSLQMQMMGFLVALIMLMRACMPPLSPPPAMPSHSSMMMTARSMQPLPAPPIFSVWLPARELLMLSMIDFPRASEALNSISLYLGLQRATSVQVVVLPMPGGPLMSAARALRFSCTGL
mmetsp:Transcript_42588/g.121397  ORF Transcript_42588/g.121397 Transcript_42588/m.121397 type:complete len:238 (-) Transcript_42588:211-924(-)